MKYFTSLTLFSLITITCTSNNTNDNKRQILDPQKTVFAFDLHGVVFKPNYTKILKRALTSLNKELVFNFLLNPFFIYDAISIRKKSDVIEEFIYNLAEKYPRLKKYVPLILSISNEQEPIAQTVDVIKQLHQHGFSLYVFSNIGINAFKELQKKHPNIFKYFSGYDVAQPDDGWIQKPTIKAYSKFLNTFNVHPSNVVFIDDKASNIQPARALGIEAFHFTDPDAFTKWISNTINASTKKTMFY